MRYHFKQYFKDVIEKIYENEFGEDPKGKEKAEIVVCVEGFMYGYRKIDDKTNNIIDIRNFFLSNYLPSTRELDKDTRNVLSITIHMFKKYARSRTFMFWAQKYMKLKESERNITFDFNDYTFKYDTNNRPYRLDLYKEMFQKEYKNIENDNSVIHNTDNPLRFYHNNTWHQCDTFFNADEPNRKSLEYKEITPIKLKVGELIESAREMDNLQYEKWEDRFKDIMFNEIGDNEVKPTDEILIDGTQHWAGKLGVGKSTTMTVIAYHLAKKLNKRTVIVLRDIADVSRTVNNLLKMEILAIPLTSLNRRKEHIKQAVYANEKDSYDPLEMFSNPSFLFFSEVCHIYNSATPKINDNDMPYKFNCYNFNGKCCPYVGSCDVLKQHQWLDNAQVIVTTIQSLIYTSLPKPFYNTKVKMIEYVLRTTDLVFIDEVDAVQAMVDSIFAPNVDLVGGESFFRKLKIQMDDIKNKYTNLFNEEDYCNWLSALNNAEGLLDRLYGMLMNDNYKVYRNLVKGTHFTSNLLFGKFSDIILNYNKKSDKRLKIRESDPVHEKVRNVFFTFNKVLNEYFDSKLNEHRFTLNEITSRKGYKDKIHPLSKQLIDILYSYQSQEYYLKNVYNWFDKFKLEYNIDISHLLRKRHIETKEDVNMYCSGMLAFIIMFSYFEVNLNYVLREFDRIFYLLTSKYLWDSSDINRLNNLRDNNSLIGGNLEYYEGILPLAPSYRKFAYTFEKDAEGIGKLTLLNYKHVGRFLINRFSELLEDMDKKKGANCVLLSGTSYSPMSTKYNIHLLPKYLLTRANGYESKITYKYLKPITAEDNGQFKPIIVSGEDEYKKEEALRKLVRYITTKDKINGKDIVDKVLEECEKGRERILMIVSSYSQVKIVRDELITRRPDMRENKGIYALDKEERVSDDIWLRQRVSEFASGSGKILIVPLMALERGYNILTYSEIEGKERRVAAFGTAMYLVRPYSKPHDFNDIVCEVNDVAMNEFLYGENKDNINKEVENIRMKAREIISVRPIQAMGYKDLDKNRKLNLLANLWVNCYQIECRLIRGDVDCNIIFADGAFFPEECKGEIDSIDTSIVIGWRDLLWKNYDEKSLENKLINELYGSRIRGLNNLKEF